MIHSVEFHEGFASKLPCLKDRKFEFTDGLNILFGPNGSGKSTILKAIAVHALVHDNGWTKVLDPEISNRSIPDRINKQFPAKVIWDGSPVFKYTNKDVSSLGYFPDDETFDGVTEFINVVDIMMSNYSSGQESGTKIAALLKKLKVPKYNPYQLPDNYDSVNSTWQKSWKETIDYLNDFPRDGKTTILLDEPDRSLDFDIQQLFWDKFISKILETHQVIIASHSIFAFYYENSNRIDLHPQYSKFVNETILKLKLN